MMHKRIIGLSMGLFVLFGLQTANSGDLAKAPAGASTVPMFEPLPENQTNITSRTNLQELLDLSMKGLRPAPFQSNAPASTRPAPPPTQLIVPPPKSAEAATNSNEAVLERRLKQLEETERRARLLPGSPLTNAVSPPGTNVQTFDLKGYELIGNTLLPPDVTELVLLPYVRSNATFDVIRRGMSDLQKVYSDQGFPTVSVTLPEQTLTNGIVKIRVLEGRVAEIMVVGNHHVSSNNVMRALPSIHTNMILNSYVFQGELDRANANQDRQIYPQIEPGPEPGTSDLTLQVRDRLPLHAKMELNNENSPGTPDLRLNTSVLDDNLWQHEHTLGFQYSFSPEEYKQGDEWNFYDLPLVANYSGFYRMPLSNPASLAEAVTNNVGNFGYSEATRHFNLPAPSGLPELNFYASRSTIDTGIENLLNTNLYSSGGNSLHRSDFQQELTVNNDVGARLSLPLWSKEGFQSTISAGVDYKQYQLRIFKTNVFKLTTIETNALNSPPTIITNHSTDVSIGPNTNEPLNYIPLSFRLDANEQDAWGITTFGLGVSGNAWYSGSVSDLQRVTGSSESSGHWAIVTPSFSRDIYFYTNWTLSIRMDAQLATEPLPANEQFGAGGVNSVRGYHEGEVFGDYGWHTSLEIKTPAHVVGLVTPRQPLTIRGSLYMDNARVYLLDPLGRPSSTSLWGVGFGAVASIGYRWEARFLFSVPLIATADVPRDELYFNFALSAQF